MSTPSNLGDLGHQVTAVFPLTTSTAEYYTKATGTSTGTKVTTSRTFDFSRLLHHGASTAKLLDPTVHPRNVAPPRFKSVTVAAGIKATFQSSGLNLYVTVAHLTRSAAAGAGSTWVTKRTQVFRWKMGTDSDGIFHTGFASSVNAQDIKKLYKVNLTFATRKASDSAAKDTTTGILLLVKDGVVMLSGADQPQAVIPKIVS
jgi:hypothetical protein